MNTKKYGTIATAVERYDTSRRVLYELLAEGHLRAVKRGATTLLDLEQADSYFASLPPWQPTQSKRVAA